jgi:hypothetical protein
MLTSFSVEDFKCFESLKLTRLSPITLVGGANNAGKTALLESLYLFLVRTDPTSIFQLYNMRGLERVDLKTENAWGPLFRDFQMEHPIRLQADFDNGDTSRLTIRLRKDYRAPASPLPMIKATSTISTDVQPPSDALEFDYGNLGRTYLMLDPRQGPMLHIERLTMKKATPVAFYGSRGVPSAREQAQMFGSLDQQGKTGNVIEALRLIEPDLDSLSIIPIGGESIVHAKLKRVAWKMPLTLAGEGMSKVLSISLFLNTAQGGLVLVDEIENGIHYSHQAEVWRAIKQMCDLLNVQLIATTHSYECLRYAVEAFHGSPESSFSFLRLQREDTGITAKRYDLEMLETAISANMEVR